MTAPHNYAPRKEGIPIMSSARTIAAIRIILGFLRA